MHKFATGTGSGTGSQRQGLCVCVLVCVSVFNFGHKITFNFQLLRLAFDEQLPRPRALTHTLTHSDTNRLRYKGDPISKAGNKEK